MSSPPRRMKPKRTTGFMCPNCLTPTRVAHVGQVSHQLIRRYRNCPECGYYVITDERLRAAKKTGERSE